ncbi:MAG: methyltransferase domain-containing protein [Mycobacteriales bacterium]|nr:methyltransferase domain-containing protein [Mycobacteriales bacterium]
MTAPVPAPASHYWRFYERVALAQLLAWAPVSPSRVLDVSGVAAYAEVLVAAGHEVVHVLPPDGLSGPEYVAGPGRLVTVRADARSLHWLADESFDAVLGEGRALSMCLAAEVSAADLRRVLRPGGRLLIVVESLVLGLARLADSGRWAELADVPSADVVLVPADDGTVTRCFWPEELDLLLTEVGLDVEWVRPRSVLSVAAVERAMTEGGEEALETLVRTELALAAGREGESTGLHLVASARRP